MRGFRPSDFLHIDSEPPGCLSQGQEPFGIHITFCGLISGVILTTLYQLEQLTSPPRFKEREHRPHLLMESVNVTLLKKKKWHGIYIYICSHFLKIHSAPVSIIHTYIHTYMYNLIFKTLWKEILKRLLMESKQRQDDTSMEVLMSISCNRGAYGSRVGRSRGGAAGGINSGFLSVLIDLSKSLISVKQRV